MCRALALVAALTGLLAPVLAQTRPAEPSLTVTVDTGSATVEALVRAEHLLAGGPFVSLLRSGFPLYVDYRVELWRTRSNWFDQFAGEVRWQAVIAHDPLSDRFLLTRSDGWREQLRDEDELARALRTVYRVPFDPPDAGRFYVVATVDATPLNDSDLDEVARWLQGDLPEAATREEGGVGDALSRSARRLLIRAAGLPKVKLNGRSRFVSLRAPPVP